MESAAYLRGSKTVILSIEKDDFGIQKYALE